MIYAEWYYPHIVPPDTLEKAKWHKKDANWLNREIRLAILSLSYV
ncbi:transaldolase [Alteromonas mediterranea UM7]|jgi:hypothetical protein|nr:transaldolase [Alteromonas mediterranea UM7]